MVDDVVENISEVPKAVRASRIGLLDPTMLASSELCCSVPPCPTSAGQVIERLGVLSVMERTEVLPYSTCKVQYVTYRHSQVTTYVLVPLIAVLLLYVLADLIYTNQQKFRSVLSSLESLLSSGGAGPDE